METTTRNENLFPKISGKHTDFLAQLRRLKEEDKLPEIMEIEGTVKLHGMHADIVFDLQDPSNTQFQSRNRVCEPNEDQHGWPVQISSNPAALRYLKDEIVSAFKWNNPLEEIDVAFPVIVAGEWIGENVQRDVGIAELTTRFVILSMSINGQWQKDADYRNVRAEKAAIYNIFSCGSQIVRFDTSNINESNPALFELQRLADMVEKCCPFAAANDIQNGRGEGIVWKPGISEARSNPRCWLKTKGPSHDQDNRIDAVRIAVNRNRNANLAEAVTRWVNPRRAQQGFEYLLEMNMYPTRESLEAYIEWILKDVLREERLEVGMIQRRVGITEKTVKAKIEYTARAAYLEQMRDCGFNPPWAASLEGPRTRSALEQDFS